jgi:hypothetical protein
MKIFQQLLHLFFVAFLITVPVMDGAEKYWTSMGLEGCKIEDLALDPSNPQILYAAARRGLWVYK